MSETMTKSLEFTNGSITTDRKPLVNSYPTFSLSYFCVNSFISCRKVLFPTASSLSGVMNATLRISEKRVFFVCQITGLSL